MIKILKKIPRTFVRFENANDPLSSVMTQTFLEKEIKTFCVKFYLIMKSISGLICIHILF